MNIKTVGVIGAGVMGVGVTQNLVQAGYQVVLLDIQEEILPQAREEIINNLRLYAMFHRKEMQKSIDDLLEQVIFTIDLYFQWLQRNSQGRRSNNVGK